MKISKMKRRGKKRARKTRRDQKCTMLSHRM